MDNNDYRNYGMNNTPTPGKILNRSINGLETKKVKEMVKDKIELFTDMSKTFLWIIIALNILFFFYSFSYLLRTTENKSLFGIITMFLLAIYSLIIFTYSAKALGFINKIPWDSYINKSLT
jgi:uncharacterized membrane protein (DUF106 family)